jgi:predicted Zn-dependent protease
MSSKEASMYSRERFYVVLLPTDQHRHGPAFGVDGDVELV